MVIVASTQNISKLCSVGNIICTDWNQFYVILVAIFSVVLDIVLIMIKVIKVFTEHVR